MTENVVNLKLHFDADQVTKALRFEFIAEHGSLFCKDGPLAGTYNFPKKAQIKINVTGGAKINDKMRFTITDLTLVSVSTMLPGESPLSMFDEYRACTTIADWSLPQVVEDKKTKRSETTLISGDTLNLTATNGQWEMSGYLSVLIEKTGSDGKINTHARLFHFDPEGTMGTGGDRPS
jgi:hypothetical protein